MGISGWVFVGGQNMKKIIPIICVLILCFSISMTEAVDLTCKEKEIITISPSIIESKNNCHELSWTKHIIENDINHASGIYACDMDNDGDKDVLACAAHDNEIAFWRNDGESPIKWTKQSIDDDFEYPMDVFSCDIDNDEDCDVIGAAWDESEISLWKNNGGNPINWNKQVIKSNYPGAHEIYACDFDSDGDLDVFGASAVGNKINWWRNDGGDPIKWTEQPIGEQFGGARSVFSIDIDGDGDNDVAGAALTDNEISWWCNEGGNPIEWTKHTIANDFEGSHHVYADDVDEDGDIDILGAAYYDNEIAWWQNEGGEPLSWNKQIIDDEFYGAMKVCVEDIDNDGDKDVIGSSSKGNSICWWSNDDGDPIIWTKETIDDMCPKAWPIQTIDFDDDGDVDVLGGSESSGGIMWYENSLYPIGSDLECEGSLSWTHAKPDSTVTDSFSIMNDGTPGSLLDWDIESYPEWGSWTFQPEHGFDVTPEEGQITVEVSVVAPDGKNQEFDGQVKIINKDDSNDFCIIDVTLATPKSYNSIFIKWNGLLFTFIENHKQLFPLLDLFSLME